MNESKQINTYIRLLKEENEKVNLYSKSSYERLDYHISDCLQLARMVSRETGTVIDMGSGSGLPSIILAIACPTMTVTAIESKRKKTRFLELVKERLELNNYTVVTSDIHQYIREYSPTPSVITAKAFAPYDKAISIASKMAHNGCELIIPISALQFNTLSSIGANEFKLKKIIIDDQQPYYYLTKIF